MDTITSKGSAVTMTKKAWIAAAAAKLAPHTKDTSVAYAETLYEAYVEGEDGEWANDPDGAVFDDMAYWDASK